MPTRETRPDLKSPTPAGAPHPVIFTIGHERATLDAVVDALRRAGVRTLVDVRELPNSRRAGFSKRTHAATLETAGIGYRHLRGLGTPKAGRDAAKRGDVATMRAIYAEKLTTDAAHADWAALLETVASEPACLLCYEQDPAGCHRRVLTERLAREAGIDSVDLMPGPLPR